MFFKVVNNHPRHEDELRLNFRRDSVRSVYIDRSIAFSIGFVYCVWQGKSRVNQNTVSCQGQSNQQDLPELLILEVLPPPPGPPELRRHRSFHTACKLVIAKNIKKITRQSNRRQEFYQAVRKGRLTLLTLLWNPPLWYRYQEECQLQ